MKKIHYVINFGENEHPYIIVFYVDYEVEAGDISIIFSKALSESRTCSPLLDAVEQVCDETGSEYEIIVADEEYGYDGDQYNRAGAENESECAQ